VLRPEGIDEFALATLMRSTSYIVPFWVSKRDGRGPFEPDELSLLDRLLPHLQRAMQLHLRLGDQKADNEALAAGAMQRRGFPTLILREQLLSRPVCIGLQSAPYCSMLTLGSCSAIEQQSKS
jgi:hypothetical protein